MSFCREEIERYGRQMILPEMGGLGQKRLRAALGRAESELEALYLAGAGVGALDVANESIAQAARALNPLVDVRITAASPEDAGRDADRDADPEQACERALRSLKGLLGL